MMIPIGSLEPLKLDVSTCLNICATMASEITYQMAKQVKWHVGEKLFFVRFVFFISFSNLLIDLGAFDF